MYANIDLATNSSMTIKTSVVVVAYNLAPYLPSCLESIIQQSNTNLEIIVVDDCSTDETLAVAQSYAAKDSRIAITSPQKNSGVFHARLIGMQVAANNKTNPSDYLLLVDGDDLLLEECVETLVGASEQSGADIVHFGFLREINGERISRRRFVPQTTPFFGRDLYKQIIKGRIGQSVVDKFYAMKAVRAMLTKEFIELSSAYRLTNAEDCLQCLALFQHARSYQPIKDQLYVYRKRDDSATMGGNAHHITNIIQKFRPTYRFAQAYFALAGLGQSKMKFLEIQVPQLIAQSVKRDFLQLGTLVPDESNQGHYPIPYTTLDDTLQRYIHAALVGYLPRVSFDADVPLLDKRLLQDLLGNDALTPLPPLTATQPLVSIIIPTYNRAPYLATCLDSIIAQTYPHLEIIIIDDGSTDHTPALVRTYQEQDRRIAVITHATNKGTLAARIAGFRAATGEYATAVDADDRLDHAIIALAVQRAQTTNADVVHFATAQHHASKPHTVHEGANPLFTLPSSKKSFQEYLYAGTLSHTLNAKLTKTDIYKKTIATSLFDSLPPVVKWDDLMFWMVAAQFVTHYQPLARIGYYRLLSDDSTLRTHTQDDLSHFSLLIRWLADFYRSPHAPDIRSGSLRSLIQTLAASVEQNPLLPLSPVVHDPTHDPTIDPFPAVYITTNKIIVATNTNGTYQEQAYGPTALRYPYAALHQLQPKRAIIDSSLRANTAQLMVFLYGLGTMCSLLYPTLARTPTTTRVHELAAWLPLRGFIAAERLIKKPLPATTLTQLLKHPSPLPTEQEREAFGAHYASMLAEYLAHKRSKLWPKSYAQLATQTRSGYVNSSLRSSIKRMFRR